MGGYLTSDINHVISREGLINPLKPGVARLLLLMLGGGKDVFRGINVINFE